MFNIKVPLLTTCVLLFICVLLFHHTHISAEESKNEPDPSFELPKYIDLVVLFTFLYLAFITESLCQCLHITVPSGGFMLILAFIWGVLAYHSPKLHQTTNISAIEAVDLMFIYIPVIMFNLSFCVDVPIFTKTLPQILVIGIPVSLATAASFGLSFYLILNSATWYAAWGFFFGILCIPHHPHSVTGTLTQQSTRTKQISVLLEGESLIVFFIADVAQSLYLRKLEGELKEWYEFVEQIALILIIGIGIGYFMGVVSRLIIRKMYTNRITAFIICLAFPFFTYSLSEICVTGCGSLSVMTIGILMGKERSVMPKEIDFFLTDVWSTAAYALDIVVCIKGAMLIASSVINKITLHQYPLLIVAYLMYYLTRFVCFLVFSPIITRLGYGMNLKNMLVCVWCGLKSPYSLELIAVFIDKDLNKQLVFQTLFYIMGIYFLSVFVNGSFTLWVLDFLQLRKVPLEGQLNMNNCLKHIFFKRDSTIGVLKIDRFLGDTNWPVVREITDMKHPYRMGVSSEEDEYGSMGFRVTHCDDCEKDIFQEPTPKEKREMIKEAKLRVLKAKKMSYSRQYENGMTTQEAMRVLNQAVELAIDSEDVEIKIEDLHKRFIEERRIVRYIRKLSETLENNSEKKIRPPCTYWRRLCYHLVVSNRRFDKAMIVVILMNLLFFLINVGLHPSIFQSPTKEEHGALRMWLFLLGKTVFTLIYFAEFIIKILAYSWVYVCKHGFRTYFRNVWNVIDFVVLLAYLCDLTIAVADMASNYYITLQEYWASGFRPLIDILRVLRYVRLLRAFGIFYPDIIRYLDKVFDSKMIFTYELGKTYTTGETDIIEMLPFMIDNKELRQEVKQKAESDRFLITKLIGVVQKERPWIAITAKTTQAIRTILTSMREAINELKSTGWVDAYEYEKLLASMIDLYKKVNSIKQVQPSLPQVIFKEVSWMTGDEDVAQFLFQNVIVKSFQPGEVVFGEGTVADGIYVVVTGLFMLTYFPNENTLNNLQKFGQLPIVDYLAGAKFKESAVDYIVSGNCIGELSTLTKRPYDCRITADVCSQVYILTRSILHRAMKMDSDSATGLECRIWKAVGVRLAIPLLLTVPAYQALSQNYIKYALERAFVPDIHTFKIFAVTDIIEDIILIDGICSDLNTGSVFASPCWIPRSVQKLVLSTSSLVNFPIVVPTKLLIIPAKDIDEYEVMIAAEDTCELVASASSKCLQHAAQDHFKREKMGPKRRENLSFANLPILKRHTKVASLPSPILTPSVTPHSTPATPLTSVKTNFAVSNSSVGHLLGKKEASDEPIEDEVLSTVYPNHSKVSI